MYDAWAQPSAEEVGGASAEVRIGLGPGGRVTERTLVQPSGNAALDTSVMAAVESVATIHGLTPAFLARHKDVTILFKVE